jgi:hypothetical protein
LKKNKNSSHKLPKQQSTSFWSQGILGIKWYPVCFPLLSLPHAIIILYLYCVYTPLQPLYSQF